MEDLTEYNEPNQKPEDEQRKTSLSRTIISLGLFIALDYWLFESWYAVLLLVTVIFIHELGHFIAMKIFGYKSLNMTFVPFVGAYVSGQAVDLSRKKKLIVLLAGPVPGIIIGSILFYLHQEYHDAAYFKIAVSFLALNLFNLLPVFPLDGGQFFQTLFFNGSKVIQLIFLYFSLAVLIYLFFQLNNAWPLLLIAVLLLMRIGYINLNNKVQKKLEEEGIAYDCSYDDLTDEHYWQIRNVIISQSKTLSRKFEVDTISPNEQQLVKYVENVLVRGYDNDLNVKLKFIFCLVWVLSFFTPIVQWLWYKGVIDKWLA